MESKDYTAAKTLVGELFTGDDLKSYMAELDSNRYSKVCWSEGHVKLAANYMLTAKSEPDLVFTPRVCHSMLERCRGSEEYTSLVVPIMHLYFVANGLHPDLVEYNELGLVDRLHESSWALSVIDWYEASDVSLMFMSDLLLWVNNIRYIADNPSQLEPEHSVSRATEIIAAADNLVNQIPRLGKDIGAVDVYVLWSTLIDTMLVSRSAVDAETDVSNAALIESWIILEPKNDHEARLLAGIMTPEKPV